MYFFEKYFLKCNKTKRISISFNSFSEYIYNISIPHLKVNLMEKMASHRFQRLSLNNCYVAHFQSDMTFNQFIQINKSYAALQIRVRI